MRTALAALRSLVFLLWMAITVVPWCCAVLVLSLFVRGAPVYWLCAGWLGMCIRSCRLICGAQWRVQGLQHLPADGPVILLPKHQSAWETFAFPMLMPKPLCYVFKRELLYIPFFGWSMARIKMIHIDRSRKSQAWRSVVTQGKQHMSDGNWVIMFPEGTRAARGSQGEYKSGGTRLALAAGVPVVPIAVTSAKCWPRKSFLIRPGMIDISIGPALPSAGKTADALMREVEVWIEAEMRRLDPQAYTAA
jgi:1-acyl-sn-glycerol-3-phosphate acyltransferase